MAITHEYSIPYTPFYQRAVCKKETRKIRIGMTQRFFRAFFFFFRTIVLTWGHKTLRFNLRDFYKMDPTGESKSV